MYVLELMQLVQNIWDYSVWAVFNYIIWYFILGKILCMLFKTEEKKWNDVFEYFSSYSLCDVFNI